MPHATRLARRLDITKQLAKFCYLLVVKECVTAKMVQDELGSFEVRNFVYRLRPLLKQHFPNATITTKRNVGYWLDDITRGQLAAFLREGTNENLSSRTYARVSPVQLPRLQRRCG